MGWLRLVYASQAESSLATPPLGVSATGDVVGSDGAGDDSVSGVFDENTPGSLVGPGAGHPTPGFGAFSTASATGAAAASKAPGAPSRGRGGRAGGKASAQLADVLPPVLPQGVKAQLVRLATFPGAGALAAGPRARAALARLRFAHDDFEGCIEIAKVRLFGVSRARVTISQGLVNSQRVVCYRTYS